MFPVLFTIPRVAGWVSHWNEYLDDPENKIVRPRQNYQGSRTRDYISIQDRNNSVYTFSSIIKLILITIYRAISSLIQLRVLLQKEGKLVPHN